MITTEELRKMYWDMNLNTLEIGKKIGKCAQTVNKMLRKAGIAIKNKGHQKGQRSKNWRGGRTIHNGYVMVWYPEHPRNKHNYIQEHILVMEKHLGRNLLSGEIVHHKNRIRSDNRIENLELTTQSEHLKKHFIPKNDAKTEIGSLIADLCLAGKSWDKIAEAVERHLGGLRCQ